MEAESDCGSGEAKDALQLTEDDAVAIYQAKQRRTPRDSARLAAKHGALPNRRGISALALAQRHAASWARWHCHCQLARDAAWRCVAQQTGSVIADTRVFTQASLPRRYETSGIIERGAPQPCTYGAATSVASTYGIPTSADGF